jgi:putative lipoic acid-binding regulatory protein
VGRALTEDERAAAIALLEQTHKFPVEYQISVIVVHVETVLLAVRAAVEHGLDAPLGEDAYEVVMSSGGRYSSHRFTVLCRTPEEVLALKDRLRRIEGVKSIL